MKFFASGANSINGDMRQTRKTPAVTMVAAWINADTGVGPSIASQRKDTQCETEIPHTVDDKRLDRGGIGGWFLVIEADQKI